MDPQSLAEGMLCFAGSSKSPQQIPETTVCFAEVMLVVGFQAEPVIVAPGDGSEIGSPRYYGLVKVFLGLRLLAELYQAFPEHGCRISKSD